MTIYALLCLSLLATFMPLNSIAQSHLSVDKGLEGGSKSLQTFIYPKTEGPNQNPHKGWNSGWDNDYENSSVGFQYIKWNKFEPSNDNFDYDYIESLLDKPGTKGRHFILRLYADWGNKDKQSDAAPEWLMSEFGVEYLEVDDYFVTDYNHPAYIAQAKEAILALAKRYNNDPRAHVFQLGILGYWGEWHTYAPNNANGDYALEITESSKKNILNAFRTHFSNVAIQGRYPWRSLKNTSDIGFHNDFFSTQTHSDKFDEAISASNKWLNGPIGGELWPQETAANIQRMFDGAGLKMINKGRYTTMQPIGRLIDLAKTQSNQEKYMKMHRKMGYNFQISHASFNTSIKDQTSLSVNLTGKNIGVAPMYYNWNVQFALLDEENTALRIVNVPIDLTRIMPDAVFVFSADINTSDLTSSQYKVAVRIIQPQADMNKDKNMLSAWRKLDERNTYVLFANELDVIDGYWNDNTQLKGGWSLLGDVVMH